MQACVFSEGYNISFPMGGPLSCSMRAPGDYSTADCKICVCHCRHRLAHKICADPAERWLLPRRRQGAASPECVGI